MRDIGKPDRGDVINSLFAPPKIGIEDIMKHLAWSPARKEHLGHLYRSSAVLSFGI